MIQYIWEMCYFCQVTDECVCMLLETPAHLSLINQSANQQTNIFFFGDL